MKKNMAANSNREGTTASVDELNNVQRQQQQLTISVVGTDNVIKRQTEMVADNNRGEK